MGNCFGKQRVSMRDTNRDRLLQLDKCEGNGNLYSDPHFLSVDIDPTRHNKNIPIVPKKGPVIPPDIYKT